MKIFHQDIACIMRDGSLGKPSARREHVWRVRRQLPDARFATIEIVGKLARMMAPHAFDGFLNASHNRHQG